MFNHFKMTNLERGEAVLKDAAACLDVFRRTCNKTMIVIVYLLFGLMTIFLAVLSCAGRLAIILTPKQNMTAMEVYLMLQNSTMESHAQSLPKKTL